MISLTADDSSFVQIIACDLQETADGGRNCMEFREPSSGAEAYLIDRCVGEPRLRPVLWFICSNLPWSLYVLAMPVLYSVS